MCCGRDRPNADSKDSSKVASPGVGTAPGEVSKGVAVPLLCNVHEVP